jgi:hypothetical protein
MSIGLQALYNNTTGVRNTAIGNNGLLNNVTGSYSIAIGYDSLTNLRTGSSNIAVGYAAATNLKTGSNNVYIGNYAGVDNVNNNIYISDGAGNLRLQIDNTGLTTVSGNVRLGRTDASQEGGEIQFNQSVNDSVKWYIDAYGSTNATTDLRFFDNTGSVVMKLNTGAKTVEVYSGIKFPASQVASSDANTLDDYEEGTWTPAYSASVTSAGWAYNTTNTSGSYIKIGKMMRLTGRLAITSTGSSAGSLYISGLPSINADSGQGNWGAMNTAYYANFATSVSGVIGRVTQGDNKVVLSKNTSTISFDMVVTDLTNNSDLIFVIQYNTTT